MMSAGGGMSAGGAAGYYYEQDPMFSQESGNGHWIGQGAEKLGLEGAIEKNDFVATLHGQDPKTGEQLVEIKNGTSLEDRRAGNDYTFSAPKSVSVAFAAGVEGIKEAHDKAVQAVAAHLEAHYSQARTPEGFVNGSMVAAKFDHSTSRALDPQLHSHLFVTNMTQTADGRWRANEPLNIYRDQKALGELYRAELSNQLQQQGHALVWTDRGSLQFELSSVDKNVTEAYSQRREAVEKQVEEWKQSGEHKGVSDAKLHEMAALATRADKDKSITKEAVEQAWRETAAAAGTSLEQIREGVEAAKQQPEQIKQGQETTEKPTAEWAVSEAARVLTDKEAVIDRSQLLQTAARISGGQHDVKALSEAIDSQAERIGATEKGRELYTTQEMRALEARNIETVKNLGEFKSVTTKAEVEQYLDKLSKTEGIKLSDGQRQHVVNELAGDKAFAVTQGDPGTGKTFASSIVERFNGEVLKPSGREHYTLNVAFTGKAASEMSDASGKPAWTIASFLNAYNSGKIQVAPAAEVAKADKQAIDGVKQASTAGQQHQAQAERLQAGLKGLSQSERHGSGGYWQLKAGNLKFSAGAAGLEGERRTQADVGFGIKKTSITRDNADGSHLSSTVHRHGSGPASTRTESGTLTRPDGQKIEFSNEKQSFLGGYITRGTKVEREKGEIARISKTSTFGNSVSGTTTTVDRHGNARETKWEGVKTRDGGLNITKSETRTYQDQDLANKHVLSTGDRATRGFLSAVRMLSNDQRRESEQYVRDAWQRAHGPQGQQPERQIDWKDAGGQGKGKAEIQIPAGAQVVLKVDEASFVGARDAEQLLKVVQDLQSKGVQVKIGLIGDNKQMQSIQAGDFFRQVQEMAKQGIGSFAALKEINRQKDNPELLKVAETLNKDGNRQQLGENAKEALGMLKEQGRVTEIKDRDQLVKATVERYMSEAAKPSNNPDKAAAGEKQSVLLVTALNKDRQELNQQIREARIEAGQIQRGETYQIQAQANTGPTADSYKPGMQVQFTGERGSDGKMHSWGAPLQSVGTVQSVNADKNTVRIAYTFERGGETKHVTRDYNAAEMQGRTQATTNEQRQFSAGDRIVFGKNDKTLDVKNGHMATIKSIDDKGNVTARIDGQKEDKSFNVKQYNNIDHGYAVTTEKSQGATVESAIQFANVKDDGKGARESYNAVNVAVTRATHEAHVMTTSEKGLGIAAERVREKTTTVEQDKTEKSPEGQQGPSQAAEAMASLRQSLGEAQQRVEQSTQRESEKRDQPARQNAQEQDKGTDKGGPSLDK